MYEIDCRALSLLHFSLLLILTGYVSLIRSLALEWIDIQKTIPYNYLLQSYEANSMYVKRRFDTVSAYSAYMAVLTTAELITQISGFKKRLHGMINLSENKICRIDL